jgi:hypothetical protein
MYSYKYLKYHAIFFTFSLSYVQSFDVGPFSTLFLLLHIQSFDVQSFDVQSFNVQFFDAQSFNAQSFNVQSLDVKSFDIQSFDVQTIIIFSGCQ